MIYKHRKHTVYRKSLITNVGDVSDDAARDRLGNHSELGGGGRDVPHNGVFQDVRLVPLVLRNYLHKRRQVRNIISRDHKSGDHDACHQLTLSMIPMLPFCLLFLKTRVSFFPLELRKIFRNFPDVATAHVVR